MPIATGLGLDWAELEIREEEEGGGADFRGDK